VAAVRRPDGVPGQALIVGNPARNPDRDLPGAGDEAWAIYQRFYPTATYLGRTREIDGDPDRWIIAADGAGTVAQILAWLTESTAWCPVLHLACHCVAEPTRPAHTRLLLAKDRRDTRHRDGALPVLDLLEWDPSSKLAVGQVFLAACTSHLSGEDYDEAFSVASAFLAAGARTVFGSLWEVPDDGTSLLMFMLHYYLNTTGCRPAQALHLARRWMLDPDREVPAGAYGMPARLAELARTTNLADPVCWAGSVHLGA
jgi:CHAT domain-containing protein